MEVGPSGERHPDLDTVAALAHGSALHVSAPVDRYFLRGLPASLRFLRHVPSLLRSRGCLPP
jgi:hypothetical protein